LGETTGGEPGAGPGADGRGELPDLSHLHGRGDDGVSERGVPPRPVFAGAPAPGWDCRAAADPGGLVPVTRARPTATARSPTRSPRPRGATFRSGPAPGCRGGRLCLLPGRGGPRRGPACKPGPAPPSSARLPARGP